LEIGNVNVRWSELAKDRIFRDYMHMEEDRAAVKARTEQLVHSSAVIFGRSKILYEHLEALASLLVILLLEP
jgi:ABC-type Fe2+-enterobactin transport system substrate-binding protein